LFGRFRALFGSFHSLPNLNTYSFKVDPVVAVGYMAVATVYEFKIPDSSGTPALRFSDERSWLLAQARFQSRRQFLREKVFTKRHYLA
jgi:hypothetical protein